MKNKFRIFLLLLLSLPIYSVSAYDKIFSHIPQPYIGVRPMAMGNAFTAVLGDHNTIFYNPAGLYDQKDTHLIVNLFRYGVSVGDSSMQKLFKDLRAAGNSNGSQRTTDLTNFVETKYGKNYFGQFSPLSIFHMSPESEFAFIPLDTQLRVRIDRQVGPTISANMMNDTTIAWGKGFSLDDAVKGLRIGTTFKLKYRVFFEKAIPILEYERNKDIFSTKNVQEGVGFDMDLGLLYHLQDLWITKPTIGFTIRNFFNFGYKENITLLNKSASNPPDDQQRYDIGSNFIFPNLWIFTPGFSADIRDLGHDNFTFKKGYHLGTEWKFKISEYLDGSLMGGLNQGYVTYGLSLQAFWYLIEYASYGEEMGATGTNIENRVHMVKMALFF